MIGPYCAGLLAADRSATCSIPQLLWFKRVRHNVPAAVRDLARRQHRHVARAVRDRRHQPAPRLPAVVLGHVPRRRSGTRRRSIGTIGLFFVAAVPVHPVPADDLDLRDADAAARGEACTEEGANGDRRAGAVPAGEAHGVIFLPSPHRGRGAVRGPRGRWLRDPPAGRRVGRVFEAHAAPYITSFIRKRGALPHPGGGSEESGGDDAMQATRVGLEDSAHPTAAGERDRG